MKRARNIAALLLVLLLAGCQGPHRETEVERERPVVTGLTVTEVRFGEALEYREVAATVAAKNTSLVAAKIMGNVTAILVDEGESVSAGQVLLTLDDSAVAQKVEAAKAAYQEAVKGGDATRQNRDLADLTAKRFQELFVGRAVSRQEFDQVETKRKLAELEYQRMMEVVNRARAGLDEALVYQGYTAVKSPVAGLVAAKNIEVGSMAVPGMALLTVHDISGLELVAHWPETSVDGLVLGTEVIARIPALNRQVQGQISEISPAIDPRSRTLAIKIALQETDIMPGLYAKLRIPVGRRHCIRLPREVLVHKGQLTGVYLVGEHNILTYRLVRVGKSDEHGVEILAGLKEYDRVVTGNIESAVDGGILQEG